MRIEPQAEVAMTQAQAQEYALEKADEEEGLDTEAAVLAQQAAALAQQVSAAMAKKAEVRTSRKRRQALVDGKPDGTCSQYM
jgi:hypothetical protein